MITAVILGTLTIPGELVRVRDARLFVTAALGKHHPHLDDAVLLTDEAVANSVEHSDSGNGGTVSITVAKTPGGTRIEVTDNGGRGLPAIQDDDQLCTSGRGLFLMEALAARWGHEPTGSGLLLWFELDAEK